MHGNLIFTSLICQNKTKKNYLTKHTVYVELTLSWPARMYEFQEEKLKTYCIFDRIFLPLDFQPHAGILC